MAMRCSSHSFKPIKPCNYHYYHQINALHTSFFCMNMNMKHNSFSGNFNIANPTNIGIILSKRTGLVAMKAWIKRQEKQKREKRALEDASEKAAIELYKQWQPNETLGKEAINIPNISVLYSTEQIESVVDAIDNDSEKDIDSHPYNIYSMAVIERLPIIARVYDYEEEYKSVLRQVKLGQEMPKYFRELYVDQLKRDDLEREKNERIRPRITEHDLQNECHSLNQSLDLRLYLLTKISGKEYWEFPWSVRQFNETLFETAHRAVMQRVGQYLHYTSITHEPFGHKQYEYDDQQQKEYGKKGGQLFFQKGYYVSGNGRPDVSDVVQDFGWFTKEQLLEKVNPVLWESLEPLLLE